MKFLDYIRGNRRGKYARQVEYDALSDPFLAEAIEGFDSVDGNHADQIARMQAQVLARTLASKNKRGAWKVAVAAVAFIALIGGYFRLMNHQASMMTAQEAENGSYINLYAPDEYIEKKRDELTAMQQNNVSTIDALQPVVDIANLHDVIKPNEVLIVYLPQDYSQPKPWELEELNKHGRQNLPQTEAEARNQELAEAVGVLPTAPALPAASIIEAKRDNVLTGRIVDQNNEPLIGASIAVKGTSNGAVTDVDGNFRLKVDDDKAKLVASYLGFESVEIPDPKNSKLISMKESTRSLSETVVVGYATSKKQSITGSISEISSDALAKSSVASKSKPIGGTKNYKKYLEDNKHKPALGECADKKGTVKLQFIVSEEDGSPKQVIVVQSLCKELDAEAIRLVKEGPKWSYSPAKVEVDIKF